MLGAIFLKGFREAISVAVVLVLVYLAVNAVVVAVGLAQVVAHPGVFSAWTRLLTTEQPSWFAVVGVALLVFPELLFVGAGEVAPVTREVLREAEPVPEHRPKVHVS